MKDYYIILGITRFASLEEVKHAFRKMAHIHHPDKGGDEAKFKEINEAYQEICKEKEKEKNRPSSFDDSWEPNDNPFTAEDLYRNHYWEIFQQQQRVYQEIFRQHQENIRKQEDFLRGIHFGKPFMDDMNGAFKNIKFDDDEKKKGDGR